MKIKRIGFSLLIVTFSFCRSTFASVKVAPYYSLNVSEGVFLPNKGGTMFSLNLVNDLGFIAKTSEKHRFVGFYELKYAGPGLRRQEGEDFTDRYMDHVLVFRHHYNFNDFYTFKTQADYMQEYKRSGTDEVWGVGLYDFNRIGGGFIVERLFEKDKNLKGNVSVMYHSLKFPNYTDLLEEFQLGGVDVETATGKQDQALLQFGVGAGYLDFKGSLDLDTISYKKQKVISDAVQSDGTFYSSTLQKDSLISFGVKYSKKLLNDKVGVNPSLSYKIKNSNQNYQHFTNATSTVPVQYLGDYYDYSQVIFALPVAFRVLSKWEFSGSLEWDTKTYSKRPPKNEDNEFLEGTQKNNLFIMSGGITFLPNEITRTTLFYTYQAQKSNMKFERYLPYNYDAHCFGINFNYSY